MKPTTYEELFNDLADNGFVSDEKSEFEINTDEFLNDYQYRKDGISLIKEMYSIEILEGENFEELLEKGEIYNIESTLHSKNELLQKEQKPITLDDLEIGDYIGFDYNLYKITKILDPTSDYSLFIEFEGSNGYHYRLTKYNNKDKFLFAKYGFEWDINTHCIDEESLSIVLTAKMVLIINSYAQMFVEQGILPKLEESNEYQIHEEVDMTFQNNYMHRQMMDAVFQVAPNIGKKYLFHILKKAKEDAKDTPEWWNTNGYNIMIAKYNLGHLNKEQQLNLFDRIIKNTIDNQVFDLGIPQNLPILQHLHLSDNQLINLEGIPQNLSAFEMLVTDPPFYTQRTYEPVDSIELNELNELEEIKHISNSNLIDLLKKLEFPKPKKLEFPKPKKIKKYR